LNNNYTGGEMKKRWSIAALCLLLGSLTMYGQALAHGTEKHGKSKPADAQMKKLHDMMPMFSVASAKLETALEKGDAAAVEAEARRILAALPDLKKSKPHKNVKQRDKFVELAKKQEETVTVTVELAKKGDFSGARAAYKKVEAICAECHAKFSD